MLTELTPDSERAKLKVSVELESRYVAPGERKVKTKRQAETQTEDGDFWGSNSLVLVRFFFTKTDLIVEWRNALTG